MRIIILLYCFCISLQLTAQQSIVSGVVSIFNSQTNTGKRQYVSNAQVEDDFGKAQPAVTNVNGQFVLAYVGVNEKSHISFQVKKLGLQVVNIDALSAVTGQEGLIKVSMAHPDSIAEYRRRIYEVGKTEAEKQLEKKLGQKTNEIKSLQKNSKLNANRIKELQQDLYELEDNRKRIEGQAQELSRKYAPVNLDDVSELFRRSFELFQSGDLSTAQSLLRQADLPYKVSLLLIEDEKIERDREALKKRDSIKIQRILEYGQGIQLKIDLHQTIFEIDSVHHYYRLLLKLDPYNADYCFNYAYFLQWINQIDSSILFYKRAIEIYKKRIDIEKNKLAIAVTLANLGNLYNAKRDFYKSENVFIECFEIYDSFFKIDSNRYKPGILTAKINFGSLYSLKGDYKKAEKLYAEALNLCNELRVQPNSPYEAQAAAIYNNLGTFYYKKKSFLKAEEFFNKALDIRENLEKMQPGKHQFDVAATLNNLGTLYGVKGDYSKAEFFCKKSLNLYKQLALKNPYTFNPEIAIVQNHIGTIFKNRGDYDKAEEIYLEALSLFKSLTFIDSHAFKFETGLTFNNLGNIYSIKGQYSKAEIAYNQALEIYKNLLSYDPRICDPEVANTQNNLGVLFSDQNEYAKAEQHYLEALRIRRTLANSNPDFYMSEVADVLNNLNILYRTEKKYTEARLVCMEALEIRRVLAKDNPELFNPQLAISENNMGIIYLLTKELKNAADNLFRSFQLLEKLAILDSAKYFSDLIMASKGLLLAYSNIQDSCGAKLLTCYEYYGVGRGIFLIEKLSKRTIELSQRLSKYYGNSSWYLLLAFKFNKSEEMANKALKVDSNQVDVRVNLAHSLLFQGKYDSALKVYSELKQLKNEEGKSYSLICLEDLEELKKQGVTHKDVERVRAFLKE